MVLRAHRGRPRLRHPLPHGCRRGGGGPGHPADGVRRLRARRAGPAGREPARPGPRVPRRRQPGGEPRAHPPGLRLGHDRGRALHVARTRPRDRRGDRRAHRGDVVRRGLGQRRHHRVLHPARRRQPALPAVEAPGRRARPAGRARRAGGRRALPPRRGPHQGRCLRTGRGALPHHLRDPGHPGRPARGRAGGGRGARAGRRVRDRAPSGHVRDAHQRRRRELPGGGGPRRRPGPRRVDRAHRPPARGAARRPRRLRRPRRQLRAARRDAPHQGHPARPRAPVGPGAARGDDRAVPRDPLGVVGWGEPRVHEPDAALRVLVAGHAALGLRPRSRHRRNRPAQAPARPRGLRPGPFRHRAAMGRRRRRDRGAPVHREP